MSPSRTRKPVTRTRPRHEVIIAVAAGVGIVAGTVLLVWLIRPGEPGVAGSGGLFSRQPRVTMLVIGAGIVLAGALWWLFRGRRRPRNLSNRARVIIAGAVVVGGAVLLGIFWPGGVVRHYQSLTQIKEAPTLPPDTTPATTSAPRATSVPTTGGG
jgi:hypothetical protein